MTTIIDIRPKLPIRDQKAATTCLAFTASAAHESLRNMNESLSPAYLYGRAWPLESHLNGRNGLTFGALEKCLESDGHISERHKPYDAWLSGAEYPGIKTKSPETHYSAKVTTVGRTYAEIRTFLSRGKPILLGLKICKSFRRYDVSDQHIVDSDTSTIGRHAVLAVGILEENQASLVLIRNSWGEGWGNKGYAYITDKYIADRLTAAAILENK